MFVQTSDSQLYIAKNIRFFFWYFLHRERQKKTIYFVKCKFATQLQRRREKLCMYWNIIFFRVSHLKRKLTVWSEKKSVLYENIVPKFFIPSDLWVILLELEKILGPSKDASITFFSIKTGFFSLPLWNFLPNLVSLSDIVPNFLE